MSVQRIRHPQKLGDRFGSSDAHEVSFVALHDGWVEDLERLHASLGTHDWELVVVDNPVDEGASDRIASLPQVVHLPLRDGVGWAAGRNLGLRQATGELVVVVDTSVELTGDVVEPLRRHFEHADVGLAGRWGVTTGDGFHFEESEGPDVDGVEAYFMALRRRDVARVGLFDPKFRWYRNADIDFSFRVRDAGFRTIVDPSLPLTRHAHRLWESTDDREELSRRNFFRFRDHWSERKDLFVGLD